MIVCVCHRVSHHDIARAVREGCTSFDELQDDLRVATACGACHDCAHETFHAHACAPASASQPTPRRQVMLTAA
jgi:bacterioferritin-associated ferredoxin